MSAVHSAVRRVCSFYAGNNVVSAGSTFLFLDFCLQFLKKLKNVIADLLFRCRIENHFPDGLNLLLWLITAAVPDLSVLFSLQPPLDVFPVFSTSAFCVLYLNGSLLGLKPPLFPSLFTPFCDTKRIPFQFLWLPQSFVEGRSLQVIFYNRKKKFRTQIRRKLDQKIVPLFRKIQRLFGTEELCGQNF